MAAVQAEAATTGPRPMLRELLLQRRDAVLARWREAVLRDYPPKTAAFLAAKTDRFANPMGHALVSRTQAVLDGLLAGAGLDALAAELDDVIRQRAVQEMRPSEAVGLVVHLRDAVRAELGGLPLDASLEAERRALEEELVRLLLRAFDVYCGHRERIGRIRVDEVRRSVATLLRRAGAGNAGEEAW